MNFSYRSQTGGRYNLITRTIPAFELGEPISVRPGEEFAILSGQDRPQFEGFPAAENTAAATRPLYRGQAAGRTGEDVRLGYLFQAPDLQEGASQGRLDIEFRSRERGARSANVSILA